MPILEFSLKRVPSVIGSKKNKGLFFFIRIYLIYIIFKIILIKFVNLINKDFFI